MIVSAYKIGGDFTNSGTMTIATQATGTRPSILFNGAAWTNTGTFTPGNSRVTFGSSTPQTITSTNPMAFYDFNMQKTSNADYITMNQKLTIADSLTLRLGQLRMNKFGIDVANPALNAIARMPSTLVGSSTGTATALGVTVSALGTPANVAIGDLVVSFLYQS